LQKVDRNATPGKIVFTVLGVVDELERSLIAERVKADVRNAPAKGKCPRRPRATVDPARIRAEGCSRRDIMAEMRNQRGGKSTGTFWLAQKRMNCGRLSRWPELAHSPTVI